MGTAYTVTGRLELPDRETLDAWLDAPLPEAPDDAAGYPFQGGSSEHTARSLIEYWTTRRLPGEINEATLSDATLSIEGMINEDDWNTYWASQLHCLALGAARAGATGEILGFDLTEPEGAALIARDGRLKYAAVEPDEAVGSLVARAYEEDL
jgi:hypothetical protein